MVRSKNRQNIQMLDREIFGAEKEIESSFWMHRREREIGHCIHNFQTTGTYNVRKLRRSAEDIKIPAENDVFASFDHFFQFLELKNARLSAKGQMGDKQGNIFCDADFINELLGTVAEFMRFELKIRSCEKAAQVPAKIGQSMQDARSPVFISERMERVLPQALDEAPDTAHLHEAAKIRSYIIDKLIDGRKHSCDDPLRRIKVPKKVENVLMQRALQTRAVPYIVKENTGGGGFRHGCLLL